MSVLKGIAGSIRKSHGLTGQEKKALLAAIQKARDEEPPPRVVLIGESGVGKSSTLNSLFNAGQAVGHARSTTLAAEWISVGEAVAGAKGLLEIADMPGLGDSINNYQRYQDLYRSVLPGADVILWVHPTSDRALHYIQYILNDLFANDLKQLASRLVFGLNKCDQVYPEDWNPLANVPSAAQDRHISENVQNFRYAVKAVLPKWKGEVVPYSALRRYKLTSLFRAMMYAVPEERRWVLESRMDLADFLELVDSGFLEAARGATISAPPINAPPTSNSFAPPSPPASADRAAAPSLPPTISDRLQALPRDEYLALVSNQRALADWIADIERGGH